MKANFAQSRSNGSHKHRTALLRNICQVYSLRLRLSAVDLAQSSTDKTRTGHTQHQQQDRLFCQSSTLQHFYRTFLVCWFRCFPFHKRIVCPDRTTSSQTRSTATPFLLLPPTAAAPRSSRAALAKYIISCLINSVYTPNTTTNIVVVVLFSRLDFDALSAPQHTQLVVFRTNFFVSLTTLSLIFFSANSSID